MSAGLKILVIFVVFVGSISAVALLTDSSRAPVPIDPVDTPMLFEQTPAPEETPEPEETLEAPSEETTTVFRPVARGTAPVREPTERGPRGTSSVDVTSGHFEEGSDCSGDTDAKGDGATTDIEEDEDEDC